MLHFLVYIVYYIKTINRHNCDHWNLLYMISINLTIDFQQKIFVRYECKKNNVEWTKRQKDVKKTQHKMVKQFSELSCWVVSPTKCKCQFSIEIALLYRRFCEWHWFCCKNIRQTANTSTMRFSCSALHKHIGIHIWIQSICSIACRCLTSLYKWTSPTNRLNGKKCTKWEQLFVWNSK